MIFGLLLTGLLLMAAALKGNEHALGQLLANDLIGTDGFIAWIFAIIAIGAIGYIPGLETASNYLLVLLLTVVILRNGGVWSNLQLALVQASASGPAPSEAPPPTTADQSSSSSGSGSGSSSGSSSGSGASTAVAALSTVAEIAAFL
jgi:uncharacterized membrane protein YgcG